MHKKEEEIKRAKRIRELETMAKVLIMNYRPADALKLISTLNSEDAFHLGIHIGGLMEVGFNKTGIDLRGVRNAIEANIKMDRQMNN